MDDDINTMKFTCLHLSKLACHHLIKCSCNVVVSVSLHTEAAEVVGMQNLQEEVCRSVRVGAALPHLVQQGMLNRYSQLLAPDYSILLHNL